MVLFSRTFPLYSTSHSLSSGCVLCKMRNLFAGLGAFQLLLGYQAVTHTFDWNFTWVTANPDGLADRKVIGINNQWPLPVREVNKGDRMVVNMFNGLGDKKTCLH